MIIKKILMFQAHPDDHTKQYMTTEAAGYKPFTEFCQFFEFLATLLQHIF